MEPDRSRFPILLAVAFVLVAGVGLARHEMWRDEMQAWLIPAESGTPAELLHNLRYEGHPALWHLLLWVVTRVTRKPEAMQVLHLAISAAAVFLFARCAPFPRPVRALAAFGYYPLYEYTVISRNYSLGMLLLFAACALFPVRRRSHLPLAGALALLAHTNPYAWLIALAFAGALILEARLDPDLREEVARRPGDAVLSLLLFGASATLAAAQMIPPPDGGFATSWFLTWRWPRASRVLATVARAWLPLPDPGAPSPWSSNLLFQHRNGTVAMVAAVLMGMAVAALRRSRPALLLYLGGSAALLGFTYVKYIGYARHHGAHFLLLLACLWSARAGEAGRRRDLPLALLLAVHVAAGAWLYAADLRHPFSAARAAAEGLRDPGFADSHLVGYPDQLITPVAGYLGRPFFYPQSRTIGTYVLWNRERKPQLHFGELCRILRRQVRQRPEGVVLVATQPAPVCGARLQPEELASFQDSLLPEERYRVYRIRMSP